MSTASEGNEVCRNCGAAVTGAYCAACGQAADVRIPTLGRFLADVVDDLYSFDSRFWRTLLPLVFRPGFLSQEFLGGRRVRYLPPLRLYLVLSLLFFVTAAWLGGDDVVVVAGDDPPPAAMIDQPRESPAVVVDCRELGIGVEFPAFMDRWHLQARLERACERIRADSGASLSSAIRENVPVMMFFFLPLVAALMKLLYLGSGRGYVEHLLVLCHFHAFFFLAGTLLSLLGAAGSAWPAVSPAGGLGRMVLIAYLPLYPLLAMRRVYAETWGRTLWKALVLGLGYGFSLVLSFTATVLLSMLAIA